jgi:16S rRNA (guanine527-N7)-methyltransferase
MPAAEVLAPYEQFLSRPLPSVAEDLESFAALLAKWNRAQNLVSRETVNSVWIRHVADSLQVLRYLRDTDRTVLDLGSGGGFPAIPLAIASKGRRDVILVEPTAKKASFLRAVSREVALGLRVENRRAEEIAPAELPPIDVITSRALAPLVELCRLAAPFYGHGTRAILHKGREHVDELAESDAVWHRDVLVHPSDTDPQGVLLELSNLRLK